MRGPQRRVNVISHQTQIRPHNCHLARAQRVEEPDCGYLPICRCRTLAGTLFNPAKGGKASSLKPRCRRGATFAFESVLQSMARRAAAAVDDLSRNLRGALCQPLHVAPRALLLGRGRLLHPGRMGLLPHRFPDPHHHAQQRPSAPAQHLSRPVVASFRLFSRSHPRSRAHGGRAWSAGRLAPGNACGRRDLCRLLDRGSHRSLPHLVCAKLAGPRGHFCRGVLVLGHGLRAAPARRQPRAAALWFSAAALCKGDGRRYSARPGGREFCREPPCNQPARSRAGFGAKPRG